MTNYRYKCFFCTKSFGWKPHLSTHLLRHINEKSYFCDKCPREFVTKREREYHREFHYKPFKCEFCPAIFSQPFYLRNHKFYLHSGHRQCKVCDKTFTARASLRRHELMVHQRYGNAECLFCRTKFCSQWKLDEHLRSHIGEKPYSCNSCNASFSQFQQLFCHNRLHEKAFKCGVCEKRFVSEYELSRHGGVHASERPHKCELCGKGFGRKGYMRIHLKTHLNETPLKCKKCGKRFSSTTALRSHALVHTNLKLKCEICHKLFKRNESLKQHLIIFHEGGSRHNCLFCDYKSITTGGISRHMCRHTKERPYFCKVCGREFKYKPREVHKSVCPERDK